MCVVPLEDKFLWNPVKQKMHDEVSYRSVVLTAVSFGM
jgi:hypothetical protein